MEISEIIHYVSLKDYAKKHSIDWRTTKKRVADGKLLLFLFRKRKVFIELSELQRFLFAKMK